MRAILFLVTLLLVLCEPAQAWWDEGHMQIAYLAYQKLTPAAKDRADALLKLNPDYAGWTAGSPVGMEKLYAFVHAATWPDDIKNKPDYYDDKVKDSTAGQIVPLRTPETYILALQGYLIFTRWNASSCARSGGRGHPVEADDHSNALNIPCFG